MSWNRQIEIDFGDTPVAQADFVVVDGGVTVNSVISGSVAYEAPTGKDLDELEMDDLILRFGAGSGQFTINASGDDGYVAGTFKLNITFSAS